ncbi:NAD(+)/NADH kinase [Halorussus halobius]|uniref:NAD(+)/NADH kinase n=1 Tax=Halorussus halobius TaxID=1710537 RepID=UPI001092026B|nr:NAD(+)/NADH kinase [Halorussus halobius]
MTVGVVGDRPLADRLRDVASSRDAECVAGSADEVVAGDPDAVVAVGEPSLLAVVRAGVSAPVLPIAAGPGYGSVDESDATAAVDALFAGEYATEARAVLAVAVGGERVGRALADVMLVTAEPARISEYAVRSSGEQVARVRADGVVVSTPTGSHGYGRSVGGPLLEPGSGVVSAVAVAPFAVNVDHWVLSSADPVELAVERDEGEVSLLLDDRTSRSVPPETPVEVVADGALELARPFEARFFER